MGFAVAGNVDPEALREGVELPVTASDMSERRRDVEIRSVERVINLMTGDRVETAIRLRLGRHGDEVAPCGERLPQQAFVSLKCTREAIVGRDGRIIEAKLRTDRRRRERR